MLNKNQLVHRLLALLLMLVICCCLAGAKLISLQLVNGETYVKRSAVNLTSTSTVSATRGVILDRYGRPMITNKSVFAMTLLYSAWQQEGQNERLLELADMAKEDGATCNDLLPVTETAPYTYKGEADDEERKTLTDYLEERDIDPKLDAPAMLAALRTYYELPAGFTDAQARTVLGLRYTMKRLGFALKTPFTLATGVSVDLIAKIKEHHAEYAGVDFETEAVRQYDTTYAAHLLGTVGVVYQDEWEGENGYSSKPGYSMNDTVGKSGIEYAMEKYLHGSNGARTVETGLGGDTVSSETGSFAPQQGDNCILTIDLNLQKVAEESLASTLGNIYDARGGAAVVIDVNSGEVLAMASYPTYDLENYNRDYNEISSNSLHPEVNRATGGVYAPGSTYKVLTAVAGLEEGVITDANWTQVCSGIYTYYDDYQPKCSDINGHGPMTVTSALKYSCNVFFYEVGRQLTGEKLEKWAAKFGLGQSTGIEVGESAGQAAGPTSRAAMIENNPYLETWKGGDDLQAAIGQSDNVFTPLQMANYIAAVVNGGTLYRPTLIKNVKTYDYSDVVIAETPEVLHTIDMSATTRELVMTGMGEVTQEGGTAATVFADYPIRIGGKTGTAETNVEGEDNGMFVAFAPYDNPEIAICVVGENAGHGSSVAPVVKDILDAYFETDENDVPATITAENTIIS